MANKDNKKLKTTELPSIKELTKYTWKQYATHNKVMRSSKPMIWDQFAILYYASSVWNSAILQK